MVAICATLILIFSSYMAARYWSQALTGKLSSSVVGLLILYRCVIALELLLPVTLYLSVVQTASRLIRQMEFTAMFSCGIGPGRIIRAVAGLALLVSILVGVLSFYARPVAWQLFYALKNRAKSSFDLSRMNSGTFYEIWDGKRVIFAERVSKKRNRAENVFIRTKGQDTTQVIFARSARQTSTSNRGNPVVVLQDGREYEFSKTGDNDFILQFRSSKMVLEPKSITIEEKIKAISTGKLYHSKGLEELAELQWRVIMPASTLLLALCGVGIAIRFTAARGGGSNAMIIAIVFFIMYYNLIALLKKWVASGVVPALPGVGFGPIVLGLVCIYLFLPEIRGIVVQKGQGVA